MNWRIEFVGMVIASVLLGFSFGIVRLLWYGVALAGHL